MRLAVVLASLVVALFAAELSSQAYFALVVVRSLEAQRADPLHYYEPSPDPVFRYQLEPGYRMQKDGKSIAIDAHGLRDDGDGLGAARRVALLGDSVPFGIGLSQEDTPSSRMQRLTGDAIKVLNFGTPGYGLEEIAHLLELKLPAYEPQDVYYLLNLNDFSRRDTLYEGADNGLYRMYHRPFLKTPYFARRAIHRFLKQGQSSSVPWYRWMYEGNKAQGMATIERMARYARSRGSRFTVVLFPPGVAYENGRFTMLEEFGEIQGYLQEREIPVLAPVAEFSRNTAALIDETDHFTAEGSEVIADVIWRDLETRR